MHQGSFLSAPGILPSLTCAHPARNSNLCTAQLLQSINSLFYVHYYFTFLCSLLFYFSMFITILLFYVHYYFTFLCSLLFYFSMFITILLFYVHYYFTFLCSLLFYFSMFITILLFYVHYYFTFLCSLLFYFSMFITIFQGAKKSLKWGTW